jgi:hypothetical protein
MKRFDSVATTGTALIDRRRLSLTAGVLFVLVVAVNAAFPERTPYAVVGAGVLYVLGSGLSRFRRTSPERAES